MVVALDPASRSTARSRRVRAPPVPSSEIGVVVVAAGDERGDASTEVITDLAGNAGPALSRANVMKGVLRLCTPLAPRVWLEEAREAAFTIGLMALFANVLGGDSR